MGWGGVVAGCYCACFCFCCCFFLGLHLFSFRFAFLSVLSVFCLCKFFGGLNGFLGVLLLLLSLTF